MLKTQAYSQGAEKTLDGLSSHLTKAKEKQNTLRNRLVLCRVFLRLHMYTCISAQAQRRATTSFQRRFSLIRFSPFACTRIFSFLTFSRAVQREKLLCWACVGCLEQEVKCSILQNLYLWFSEDALLGSCRNVYIISFHAQSCSDQWRSSEGQETGVGLATSSR
jgi:hypothetical protein